MKMGSLTGAVVFLLVLSACGEGQSGPRMQACRAYCAKLELCDDRTDVDGCERHCAEQLVRSDLYLDARASCVERSSCNVWAGEVGVMGEELCTGEACALADCTEDELAQREPSIEQRGYCAALVNKLNACDRAPAVPAREASCLALVPALSVGYLADARACSEGDCGEIQACLQQVADRFDTELTFGTGAPDAATPM